MKSRGGLARTSPVCDAPGVADDSKTEGTSSFNEKKFTIGRQWPQVGGHGHLELIPQAAEECYQGYHLVAQIAGLFEGVGVGFVVGLGREG